MTSVVREIERDTRIIQGVYFKSLVTLPIAMV